MGQFKRMILTVISLCMLATTSGCVYSNNKSWDDLTPEEKQEAEEAAQEHDPYIEDMIAQRQAAKKNKDFALADKIRDDLKAQGITLIDTPQGVKWKREQ